MRIAQKTTFDLIQYRLNKLVGEINEANRQVSTGKRINTLSDDPVGLTQVLDIRSNLSNLDQLERNIATGRTWLNAAETALSSVNDCISDAKVLALSMRNDTMSEIERADAAEQIKGLLSQIVELSNTRVNGQYIFSGTKTDIKPFTVDDEDDPSLVTYSGNDSPFSVKIGKDTELEVGHDGEVVFTDSALTVGEINNAIDFKEVVGAVETDLTATISSGSYTASQLASALEAAMEASSAAGGNSVDYTVSYNAGTKTFSIEDGTGTLDELQLLWETGANAATSLASDMGFGGDYGGVDETGGTSYSGSSGVEWGIFKTLIDLVGYFENNDGDGISRALGRLDAHFNRMSSTVSSIGSRELRLDIKEKVIADLDLSYETKRAEIEDADMIEAISELTAKQTIYEAALASSAKIMNLSLVDYL